MKSFRPFSNHDSRLTIRRSRGFSLIEMMVTIVLLGFIVVGLVAMFAQTQKVFRSGNGQTDVLEAGRAAMDLFTREIEEAAPTDISSTTNFYTQLNASSTVNLPGSTIRRTNVLDSMFFTKPYNQSWFGIGYVVAWPSTNLTAVNIGTLYHYQSGITNNPANLVTNFLAMAANAVLGNVSTNLSRVCDGVVCFSVQAYTTNGILITPFSPPTPVMATKYATNSFVAGEYNYTFTNNAVPAYVDVEMDVLEQDALAKFKALPSPANINYLARVQTAGKIHVFRRRITMHNVDPSAYQ